MKLSGIFAEVKHGDLVSGERCRGNVHHVLRLPLGDLMLKLLIGNPWVIVGLVAAFAGLFGWAIWERHDAIAAAKGEKAALERADLAEQDAKRWHDASDVRDGRITSLAATLDQQSALVQAGKAREAELRVSLDTARAQNESLAQQRDELSKELDDETAKTPGDVRDVGPIVLRRAPSLFN